MTIKDFKEKLSKKNVVTGAKKVAATTTLVVALVASISTTAYAEVPSVNIIGDLQYTEDRTEVKRDDYRDIQRNFYGYDRYGNPTITTDEVRKSIELSNLLNGFYFDPVEYTNTRKSEVLNLNIDKLYENYLIAFSTNNDQDKYYYCLNNLTNKPAIDANITFSCGTIANYIKTSLGNRINSVIASEGYKITADPQVVISDTSIYVLVEVKGQLQKIELEGDICTEIINLYQTLNSTYTTALNNIGGYSNQYENSFAYNGIDIVSKESAWLSLPDEVKKENLLAGVELYETLETPEKLEIISNNPDEYENLTRAERKELRNLGYDADQVSDAIKRTATLNKVLPKSLSK